MEKVPTPILMLPWELLLIVFLYLRQTPGSRHSIASVCRPWRQVIINTPSFWTELVIFSSYRTIAAESIARLDAQFRRSGTLPLSIHWDCTAHPQAQSDDMAAMAPQARIKDMAIMAAWLLDTVPLARWQSLLVGRIGEIPAQRLSGFFSSLQDLTVKDWGAMPILTYINSNANQLHTVCLATKAADNLPHDILNNVVGKKTTLQTSLFLELLDITRMARRLHLAHLIPEIRRPFPTITELVLDTFWVKGGTMVSTYLPNLETLVIYRSDRSRGGYATFPHLRHLVFSGPAYGFLARVEAPMLQSLRLLPSKYNHNDGLRTFTETLDDPTYQLSPITLHMELLVDMSTITQLLALSPRLKHLTLGILDGKQCSTISSILLRSRSVSYNDGEDQGSLKWELCEGLLSLKFRMRWPQNTQDILDATKAAKDILKSRNLKEIRVIWKDANEMVFIGQDQTQ